jgi:hypothetical protein
VATGANHYLHSIWSLWSVQVHFDVYAEGASPLVVDLSSAGDGSTELSTHRKRSSMNGHPSTIALLFYTTNFIIVFGYIAASFLMIRPKGFHGSGRAPWVTVISSVTFFICCAYIHFDLAYHAYTYDPFLHWNRAMPLDWDLFVVICIKTAAIWTFILSSIATGRSLPLAPSNSYHRRFHPEKRDGERTTEVH